MSRFIGKNTNRLSSNPREREFSKAWEKENDEKSGSLLSYMLSEDGGKTLPETSDRDEMIAATVIQWLGSPVGESFLQEVQDKVNNAAT